MTVFVSGGGGRGRRASPTGLLSVGQAARIVDTSLLLTDVHTSLQVRVHAYVHNCTVLHCTETAQRRGSITHADLFRTGTFPRAAIRARKRTLVNLRAVTLRAEKIGALSDRNHS